MNNDPNQPSNPETDNNDIKPVDPPSSSSPVESSQVPPEVTGTKVDEAVTEPVAPDSIQNDTIESIQVSPGAKGGKRKLLLGIVVFVLLLALASVGWVLISKDNSKDNNTGNSSVAQVQPIPVVKVGGQEGPIGTDYIFPNAPSAEMSININFQVFEGLVGFKDQKIVPLLSTSWTNPNNTTWVFQLKQGVTFQNGKPMTAADVKSSLEADMKNEGFGQYLSTIKTVSVSGANQVTITTTTPDALLLNRLVYGYIFSNNADGTVSGTGAYSVDVAKSKTADKTVLVAYKGYHQGVPKTQEVDYQIYNSVDDLNKAMENGTINLMSDIRNTEFANKLATKNIKSVSYESNGVLGLQLNMLKSNSPLMKPEVRQALATAVDRANYVKTAGVTGDLRTASLNALPKHIVGYSASADFPGYDTQKTKDMLTKAGYTQPPALTFAYIKDIQSDVPALVAQLNKSGFNITAVPYDTPDLFIGAISEGKYDIMEISFGSDLGDGVDTFSNLLGSNSMFPSYSNKDFDKMIETAEQTFKASDHLKKVQEINQFVADNYLWIPLTNRTFSIYYPANYNYKLVSSTGLIGMYFWELGQIPAQPNN